MGALAGIGRSAGVVTAGVVLTLIALMFNNAPLFVPAVAFMGLGIAMPIWVTLAARRGRARRRLTPERVLENQRFETVVDVRRGRLGLPGAELVDPVTGTRVSLGRALSPVSRCRRVSVTIVARFSRRGRKVLAPPVLFSRDALGLAQASRTGATDRPEILVLPRTEAVRWIGQNPGARPDASTAGPSSEPLAAVELDGLRPYRVGTPASRIHWPALARGAGLLERRMRADGSTRPLVVLDTRCAEDSWAELDAAVRAAGSLVLELARRGGCGLLMPGERRPVDIGPDLARWPGVHVRLALVGGGPDRSPPRLSPTAGLGRIFYVAVEPPRRLPQALTRPGQPPGLLVLPAGVPPRARGTVAFEVAGCRGYLMRGTGRESRAMEAVA